MGKKNEEKNAPFLNFSNILIFFTFVMIFRTKKKICLQIFLCGPGSALDQDSNILWIRIRIEANAVSGSGLNPSGSTTLLLRLATETIWSKKMAVIFIFHPSFYVGSGILDEKYSDPDP
jgi:hypothetical protein